MMPVARVSGVDVKPTTRARMKRQLVGAALGVSVVNGVLSGMDGQEATVSRAFDVEFGLRVPRPAIYDDPANGGCRGERKVVATAYAGGTTKRTELRVLYFAPSDMKVIGRAAKTVLRPSGRIDVLVALIAYPQTVGEDATALWTAAQARVNAEHVAYARSIGRRDAIVQFANTNVFIDPRSDRVTPRNPTSVREALTRAGARLEAFDILMTIDINPLESVGGYALESESAIYVGNVARWKEPLDEVAWQRVAAAAYNHEMAHHWGWDHDWSPTCGRSHPFGEFATSPILLGWTDVDGDGVPEIRDDTPYGSAIVGQSASPIPPAAREH